MRTSNPVSRSVAESSAQMLGSSSTTSTRPARPAVSGSRTGPHPFAAHIRHSPQASLEDCPVDLKISCEPSSSNLCGPGQDQLVPDGDAAHDLGVLVPAQADL